MAHWDTYKNDLAISAVSYDALLVAELSARLESRLRYPPSWSGPTPATAEPGAALREDISRVVLILGQRLWGLDPNTAAETAVLRERAHNKPRSVVVVSLDDDPLPEWMAPLARRELATVGLDGVVEFVLDAVASARGTVLAESAASDLIGSAPVARWPEPPTPFLAQPRAHSALRRELDALCAELEPQFEVRKGQGGDHLRELHKMPHRVIARVDDVGVSFSWVPGRAGTVADGRLMVIEWRGVASGRGIGALRTAQPVRECVYIAEARGTDDWCWRADVPNGRASSTANLVSEWVAGAAMTLRAAAASV